MDLKELLKRWSELEPQRCDLIDDGNYWSVIAKDGHRWRLDKRNLIENWPTEHAKLQFAVQEAIKARGWGFVSTTIPSYAQVDIILPSEKTERGYERLPFLLSRRQENDFLTTLLFAYIAALEAQKKQ